MSIRRHEHEYNKSYTADSEGRLRLVSQKCTHCGREERFDTPKRRERSERPDVVVNLILIAILLVVCGSPVALFVIERLVQ